MKTAEERAEKFVKDYDDRIGDFNLNLEPEEKIIMKAFLFSALKEQDKITRHACAEACMVDEAHTGGGYFHNVCINTKSI